MCTVSMAGKVTHCEVEIMLVSRLSFGDGPRQTSGQQAIAQGMRDKLRYDYLNSPDVLSTRAETSHGF
jgi:hypothetical protein